MYQTTYHRPSSVDEAAALFAKGKEAKYLAGGHTLIPVMKQRLAAPSDVIDLGKIKELVGVEASGDTLTIKAATSHYDVTQSDAVKKALRDVVQRKTAIEQARKKRQELERQITVIDQEQKRIRDNMAQLPKDSDLFRRYVTKFTEQEDQVDALRKQMTAAIEEEQRLQKSLDEFLAGLSLS